MKRGEIITVDAAKMNLFLAAVLSELKRRNYKLKFKRETTCLYCFELDDWIMPENFMVDESYYFEEIFNPGADRMLYAISLSTGGKGFLIDTCNVYMDNISIEMIQKLKPDDLIKTSTKKKPIKLMNEIFAC